METQTRRKIESRRSVLCRYYARGVALVLVGLALARLTGILGNPALMSQHAIWAARYYPLSLSFFYLAMALLYVWVGFLVRDEREVYLLVGVIGVLMLVAAAGHMLLLWLGDDLTGVGPHRIATLAIGSTSILLAGYARGGLATEQQEDDHL